MVHKFIFFIFFTRPKVFSSFAFKITLYELNKSAGNPYRIPELYEERLACNMPLEHFIYTKRDPLMEPTMTECLSIGLTRNIYLIKPDEFYSGCCWETDETIVSEFPNLPRCYRVADTGVSTRPNFDDLQMRSADIMFS